MDYDITFGTDGNSFRYELNGWSVTENSLTWTAQEECHLLLPSVGQGGPYVLELHLIPYMHQGQVTPQFINVSVNGIQVGASRVIRRARLAYVIPQKVVRPREPVRVMFSFPAATTPGDTSSFGKPPSLTFGFTRLKLMQLPYNLTGNVKQMLPIEDHLVGRANHASNRNRVPMPTLTQKIRRLTGVDPIDLMLNFESLGQSCEFGLVQRRCGAEPLGLFRFSSIFLDQLLRGIDSHFDGLGEPNSIDIRLSTHNTNPEFYVAENNYEMIYHTFVYAGQAAVDDVRAPQSRRIQFLKRKLLDDQRDGRKIFVRTCRPEFNAPEEMMPLFLALNHDHENSLLWVIPANDNHPPGAVDRITAGLFIGYIDSFAPQEEANDLSLDVWLSICTNAYLLSREQRYPSEQISLEPE